MISRMMERIFFMSVCLQYQKNIAITRDPTIMVDGAGSQLQRSYCTYGLSRFLKISYLHSPLIGIPYEGLAALEKNQSDPTLLARYNKTFPIPSDLTLPRKFTRHRLTTLDEDGFLQIQEEAKSQRTFHLIELGLPYRISDRHPEILTHVKAISPFERSSSPLFRIAIHVRRGDLFAVDSHRMLPNAYYTEVANMVTNELTKHAIPFRCELHTEIPSAPILVTPSHYGIGRRIEKPVLMTREMSHLEDFDDISCLEKYLNLDPIKTIALMATADLLVISRSSFSFLSAILNKKGIILYHPFWHAAPIEWIDTTHVPSFQPRLAMAIESWKKDRERRS
jgi:hypothetical protein